MDKERIKGSVRSVGGKIKEGIGRLLGDRKTRRQGQAEQAEGQARKTVGEAKDKAREAADKARAKP